MNRRHSSAVTGQKIVDCEFSIAKQSGAILEHEASAFRQILDAGYCLDGADFPGIYGYALRGAYLPFFGAVPAMARSPHYLGNAQLRSNANSQSRTRDRIRHSRCIALACSPRRDRLDVEPMDVVRDDLGIMRDFCGHR